MDINPLPSRRPLSTQPSTGCFLKSGGGVPRASMGPDPPAQGLGLFPNRVMFSMGPIPPSPHLRNSSEKQMVHPLYFFYRNTYFPTPSPSHGMDPPQSSTLSLHPPVRPWARGSSSSRASTASAGASPSSPVCVLTHNFQFPLKSGPFCVCHNLLQQNGECLKFTISQSQP